MTPPNHNTRAHSSTAERIAYNGVIQVRFLVGVFSVLCADIQNAHSSAVRRLSGLLSLTASNPKHENELQGDFLMESLVGLGIGQGIRLVIA